MKCETCYVWMSSYIDNELKGEELIAFEDHLNHCTSCQEELGILGEIVKDISALEERELPDGFHQNLMERIQLEGKISQNNIIQVPKSRKKWYSNWRMASGLAAAFIFSVLIFEILNMNSPKEALPESASIQVRTGNIEEVMPKMASDVAEGAPMRIFNLEGPKVVTWEIQTKEYDQCKKRIMQISEEMRLEKTVVEDTILDGADSRQLIIEITLEKDIKDILTSRITEACKDDEIKFYEDDQQQGEFPGDSMEILVVTINEVK